MQINWSINQSSLIDGQELHVGETYSFNKTKCPVFPLNFPVPILDNEGTVVAEGRILDTKNKELGEIVITRLINEN